MNEYQKIIKKYYNPRGIHFESDAEYEKLFHGWEVGSPTDKKELYEKIYYYTCDYVAHLFEAEYLSGNFEDALQDAYIFLIEYKKPLPCTLPKLKTTISKYITTCFEQMQTEEKEKNWHLNFEKNEDISAIIDENINTESSILSKLDTEELFKKSCQTKTKEQTDKRCKMAYRYVYEGKTPSQIAKELDCSKDQVLSNVSQVLKKSRAIVEKEKEK